MASFDPLAVLNAFAEHDVRYVVVGGVAAAIHGSPSDTYDLDVCYDPDPANVARLEQALSGLGAAPARWDAIGRATFATADGQVDCVELPAGSRGYPELARTAETVEIAGTLVAVASLDELLIMKRAAGRPKDRVHLEILGALREEIEAEGG